MTILLWIAGIGAALGLVAYVALVISFMEGKNRRISDALCAEMDALFAATVERHAVARLAAQKASGRYPDWPEWSRQMAGERL